MFGKKQLFYPSVFKGIALVLSVLVTSLSIGYFVFAWSEPLQIPPGCNSGDPGCDAPINVSSIAQTKTGNLTLNALGINGGGAASGSAPILWAPNGNVGLGTIANPVARLEIDMRTPVAEGLHISRDGAAAFSYLNIEDEGNNPIFKVHESGNVGIGTTNPRGLLQVQLDDLNIQWSTSVGGGLTGNIIIEDDDAALNLIGQGTTLISSVIKLSEVETLTGDYQNLWALWRETNTLPGTGDGDFHISYTDASGSVFWHTSPIKFTIKTNGNVGIGTIDPQAVLHVKGDEVLIESDGSAEINFIDNDPGQHNWKIGTGSTDYLTISMMDEFNHNSTLETPITMRYYGLNDIRVGINKFWPNYELDVNGTIRGTDYRSGDGSQGLTTSVIVKGSTGIDCTLTFKDGLLTAETCP